MKKKVVILENELQSFRSFWYTRFQGALFLLALLTYGLGDALTSSMMIERHGLMAEGNAIVRYIISDYGIAHFIEIKIWFTLLILLVPFILFSNKKEPIYWMMNGYLASFFISGTLAMILNLQAGANEPLFLQPQHVILIFISLILILTNIGELIDKMQNPIMTNYFVCALYDLLIVMKFFNNTQEKKWPDTIH
jgi:hypothetical protein